MALSGEPEHYYSDDRVHPRLHHHHYHYARRMGQPTQRATNYTARSNIDTAQIFLHSNGQRPKRAPIRQRSRRRQRRGEPHTEDGLGVLLLAQHISHSHSGIDEKRPTVKCVCVCSVLFVYGKAPFLELTPTPYTTLPGFSLLGTLRQALLPLRV